MSGRPSRKTTREPTDSSPPVLEMSKPSIARGRAGSARAVFSSSRGLASPACLREESLGVAPGHFDELAVLPAAGDDDADLGPAEERLEAGRSRRSRGQEQARRQLAVAVEAGQESAQDLGVRDARRRVDEARGRAPDLALAHEEDVDGRAGVPAGQADDVLVLEGCGDRPGPVPVVLDRAQEVAAAGRLLELLVRGRPLHSRLEGAGQLGHAALEEETGVLDVLAVIGLGDRADAGRRAELELVLETGALAAAEDGVLAAADEEVLVDEVDGRAGPPGRAEGAEIAGAVRLDLPAEVDAGPGLAGRHLEVGEALVVLEAEVEAGLVLLDVIVLQEGGFLLGAGQDVIDVRRLAQDVADLEVRIGQEVGADAVPKGAGLADVDDLAGRVLEEVDAGLGREPGRFLLQLVEISHVDAIFRLSSWIFKDLGAVRERARAPAS